jgi:hypothetical protein
LRGRSVQNDFPQGKFERDFPKRHHTHMDVVCCLQDSRAGTTASLLWSHSRPEKRLRIEQTIHVVKKASSVRLKSSCMS